MNIIELNSIQETAREKSASKGVPKQQVLQSPETPSHESLILVTTVKLYFRKQIFIRIPSYSPLHRYTGYTKLPTIIQGYT